MKKLILTAFIALASLAIQAQTKVITDAQGNYHAIKSDSIGKTAATNTGKTFTDTKGIKYPVLLSKNGKLFYIKTSKKTGLLYNVYLTN